MTEDYVAAYRAAEERATVAEASDPHIYPSVDTGSYYLRPSRAMDQLELKRPKRWVGEVLRGLLTCPSCAIRLGYGAFDDGKLARRLVVVAYRAKTVRLRCVACDLRFSVEPVELIRKHPDLTLQTRVDLICAWRDRPDETPEERLAAYNAIVERVNEASSSN